MVQTSSVNSSSVTDCISRKYREYTTPSELVYGKNLRAPETLVMEHWMEPEEESDLVTEYTFKLINRFKRCQEVAINKMEEIQVKRKTWYDKNAVKRELKNGDLVLVLAISRANKLAVQWIGPGTILNKISETNYLVEIPGRRETSQIYHINMLKPYYKRPEHVNVEKFDDDIQKVTPARAPLAFSFLSLKFLFLFHKFNSFSFSFHSMRLRAETALLLAACHNGHSDRTLSAADFQDRGESETYKKKRNRQGPTNI
ncbi:CCHC-type domain-containing protein [Trichonephila clavipes]|nr:CCHC-type domain-containing protein [Trichonephila clavipes]